MKFAILGSGTGSNAEAILQAWRDGRLGRAEPVLIASDRPEARILSLGPRFGVPARFLFPGPFKTKMSDEAEVQYAQALRESGASLVVLAGFMRVIHGAILEAYPDAIINLHPSLLPSFPGLHSIRQAFDHGVKITGCTVHRVTAGLDTGPILDQTAVRIEAGDTLENLEAKVHRAEHQLLPSVIVRLAEAQTS